MQYALVALRRKLTCYRAEDVEGILNGTMAFAVNTPPKSVLKAVEQSSSPEQDNMATGSGVTSPPRTINFGD